MVGPAKVLRRRRQRPNGCGPGECRPSARLRGYKLLGKAVSCVLKELMLSLAYQAKASPIAFMSLQRLLCPSSLQPLTWQS